MDSRLPHQKTIAYFSNFLENRSMGGHTVMAYDKEADNRVEIYSFFTGPV
jgi:hypothetical protein